jgi:plasmid stabilization system protein ParE
VSGGRYTVVWTEVALQDVDRLAPYMQGQAPLRADQIIDRIVARGESLESSAERGRTPLELRAIGDRSRGIRALISDGVVFV